MFIELRLCFNIASLKSENRPLLTILYFYLFTYFLGRVISGLFFHTFCCLKLLHCLFKKKKKNMVLYLVHFGILFSLLLQVLIDNEAYLDSPRSGDKRKVTRIGTWLRNWRTI